MPSFLAAEQIKNNSSGKKLYFAHICVHYFIIKSAPDGEDCERDFLRLHRTKLHFITSSERAKLVGFIASCKEVSPLTSPHHSRFLLSHFIMQLRISYGRMRGVQRRKQKKRKNVESFVLWIWNLFTFPVDRKIITNNVFSAVVRLKRIND